MIRSLLFVLVLTLLFGGGIKLLNTLTIKERQRFSRGVLFWVFMTILAVITTFFITVSF